MIQTTIQTYGSFCGARTFVRHMTYFLTMITNFIVEPITERVALITNKQSPSLCINQVASDSRGNLKCNCIVLGKEAVTL